MEGEEKRWEGGGGGQQGGERVSGEVQRSNPISEAPRSLPTFTEKSDQHGILGIYI
jgi:hypothetical protein